MRGGYFGRPPGGHHRRLDTMKSDGRAAISVDRRAVTIAD
jgi:hypothetical protein